MLESHARNRSLGCKITIAYHTPEDLILKGSAHTNYGVLCLGPDDRVTGFVEKAEVSQLPSRLANSGVFVLSREPLNMFPAGRPLDFSRDVFSRLAAGDSSPIFGFDARAGYRYDIGTVSDFVRWQFAILDGVIAPVGVPWGWLHRTGVGRSACVIDGKALIAPDCQFGHGVKLRGRNIIGNAVTINAEAELSDCIVLSNSTIGSRTRITGAVLGRDCRIASNAVLHAEMALKGVNSDAGNVGKRF